MIDPGLPAAASTPLQIVGGCLLLADMMLAAALFAFWDKAARIHVTIGRRRRS